MSSLQSDSLREAIATIITRAQEKPRKFTKTVELQIGLKNYDPQQDKHFNGPIKLPHIPRPKMKVGMIGDAQNVEEPTGDHGGLTVMGGGGDWNPMSSLSSESS